MTLTTLVGTADKDSTGTNGATQDITTSGVDPKALVISGCDITIEGQSQTIDGDYSQGFSDGTNHRAVCFFSEDGVGTSNTRRTIRTDAVLVFLDAAGAPVARASVTFGTGKFTLTWDINDTVARKLKWIVYGGTDITGIQVLSVTKSTAAAPVNQSISLDADVQNITAGEGVVMLLDANRTAVNNEADDAHFCFGCATKTTEEACYACTSRDAQTTTDCNSSAPSDKIVTMANDTGTLIYEGEFNGFTAGGLDINFTTNDSQAIIFALLVIKGGKWQCGQDTEKATTGTKATTTDFQPQSALFAPTRRTGTAWAATTAQPSLGLADGTNEELVQIADADNVGTTLINSHSSATKCNGSLDQAATNSEADLDSFNATDFTLDWTKAVNALRFLWLVCADAVSVAPVEQTQGSIIG